MSVRRPVAFKGFHDDVGLVKSDVPHLSSHASGLRQLAYRPAPWREDLGTMIDIRTKARKFAERSIVTDATARLIEQVLTEAHAALRYTDEQKEWLARYLATSLASGPDGRVHKVDIDEWIKEVKHAFDVIEKHVAPE